MCVVDPSAVQLISQFLQEAESSQANADTPSIQPSSGLTSPLSAHNDQTDPAKLKPGSHSDVLPLHVLYVYSSYTSIHLCYGHK